MEEYTYAKEFLESLHNHICKIDDGVFLVEGAFCDNEFCNLILTSLDFKYTIYKIVHVSPFKTKVFIKKFT